MKYDKKSFCAGITVGTQLKGWASAGGGGAGGLDGTVHVFPKADKLFVPPVMHVRLFGRFVAQTLTVKVPNVIPVDVYEGGEQ